MGFAVRDKRGNVAIDLETYQRLHNLARRTDRSMCKMLRVIVRDYEARYFAPVPNGQTPAQTSITRCLCGTEAGYSHAWDCPYPCYSNGIQYDEREWHRWVEERDEIRRMGMKTPRDEEVMNG